MPSGTSSGRSWGWKSFVVGVLVGGMQSLVRQLLLVFWMVCGIEFARLLGGHFGPIGIAIGFPAGILLSSILTWAVWLARVLLFQPFPPCGQQNCRGMGDYSWNLARLFGWEKWGVYRYQCRCGDEYVRIGRQFMRSLPDGTLRPYKRLTGWRTWMDDTGLSGRGSASPCNGPT